MLSALNLNEGTCMPMPWEDAIWDQAAPQCLAFVLV